MGSGGRCQPCVLETTRVDLVLQQGMVVYRVHANLICLESDTLISIMIVFFLAQEKTILIPKAENKDRSGVIWLRNLNLSFFYREKKNSHYGNQSISHVSLKLHG